MYSLGIPVPEGFALTVQAYEIFMERTGAKDDLVECLAPVLEHDQPALEEVEETSKGIYEIMVNRSMPDELEEMINKFYDQLCEGLDIEDAPVAIRSSGAISMPGHMESYLNVRCSEDVILNIKKVWASGYTPRAVFWRINHDDMRVSDARMGVAVIRMIEPRAAGVGFTANPATGDRKSVMIEGNWGVRESIVKGLVNPDVYYVDKENLQVGIVNIGTKYKYYELLESGIELKHVPEEKRSKPCLSEEEALELTILGIQLEGHFLSPQDFEWVIDKHTRRIYLVQTRPAKNLPPEKTSTEKLLDLMMSRF